MLGLSLKYQGEPEFAYSANSLFALHNGGYRPEIHGSSSSFEDSRPSANPTYLYVRRTLRDLPLLGSANALASGALADVGLLHLMPVSMV